MRVIALILYLAFVLALRAEQPNVVLILADDYGWVDATFTGSRYYKTPNLDRLAAEGTYFSNAYSASPLCSPTRSSIMTGQSPARTGLTAPVCHLDKLVLEPNCRDKSKPTERQVNCESITRLPTEHFTLAEALKEGGYVTGHFGKWHLGAEPYSPLEHGFDVDVPHWPGPGPAGSFVAPWKFPDFKERYPQEHIEDRMGDEAVSFIEKHKGRPFYLNYWQFSVHAPFDAKAKLIEHYRKTRDPRNPQQSPTYAAMVHSLDDNVGKILDALKRLGLEKNTVVIFYSDNGGNMYDLVDENTATSNRPLRGGKATIYEGGIRIPAIVKWPGVVKGGTVNQALVQSEDLYPTILEIAGLPSRPEQALDAVSMVPALKTGNGARDAVYCYFPHSPAVPDWSPPSVCVRQGDWKLIRLFHDSDTGDRFELYNLKDDIGERNNLAAQQPERIRAMNALLNKFLQRTGALTPRKNSQYDPEAVDRTGGWKAVPGSRLNPTKNMFHLRSFSRNPGLVCEKRLNLTPGRYTLKMRIRSWAEGSARLFWAASEDSFNAADSVGIDFTHNGLWHECTVPFDIERPVEFLRINPASGEGSTYISSIELMDSSGKVRESWDKAKVASKAVNVGGWSSGFDDQAHISGGKETLVIKSVGKDPKLISRQLKIPPGEYVFALRIKSAAGGGGLVFTRSAARGFERGSGTPFELRHDNRWQEIEVRMRSEEEINQIRLDPCTEEGVQEIDWIRLSRPDGKLVREWNFDK